MFFEKDNNKFKFGKNNYEKAILAADNCTNFKLDRDEEEFVTSTNNNSCYNCLFRRWTSDSFTCMYNFLNKTPKE